MRKTPNLLFSFSALVAMTGCSSAPERTKEELQTVAEKRFLENGYQVVGRLYTQNRFLENIACYSLKSMPDNGHRYEGCINQNDAITVRNLDIS